MKSATIAIEKTTHRKLSSYCRPRGIQLGHEAGRAIEHWVKLIELGLLPKVESLLDEKRKCQPEVESK